MQFKAILAISLLGSAYAAPIEGVVDAVGTSQDLVTITTAFNSIEQALTALGASVKGLSPGAGAQAAAADILAKSKAVEQVLKESTSKVDATSGISLVEALQVQSASTKLTTLTTNLINDLVSKKDVIQQAGQTKVTLDNLLAQKSASDGFVKAVTAKVPAAVQSIAAQASKSVGDALAKGISAFGGAAKRAVVALFK